MLATLEQTYLISSPLAVLTTLAAITSAFFFLEHRTKWKLFSYVPPLVFIYVVPMLLSNTGLLAHESPVYDVMSQVALPFLLVVMLLKVDVVSTVRVMGKGVLVMLCGTAGVVLGAPLAYALIKSKLDPTGWKAFGTLAGSWIGGTGNMAAVSEGIEASGTEFGLAVLGDNAVYLLWLPVLLAAKSLAGWFNRFARVDPKRIKMLEASSADLDQDEAKLAMRHLLYLLFLGLGVTLLAEMISQKLPAFPPVLTAGSWKILLVTTLGLLLSATPARKIPGSHELAMALVYLFVANMGARANLAGLKEQALWFVLGAYVWIVLHGIFCILGARLFHVDIHSTAIASAANIGGAASAPVVAAHHNPKLVPVSILMALIGYAIGNYGAFVAAWLCQLIA
ncbi:MAG: DUF819 family protein [Phycisphaerales bacterium]|nr:MAG: DUF819 family protein [Phycisphaerales bacterium]